MEITGLDITLRRIQAIEQNFSALTKSAETEPDSDFARILDANMTQNPSNLERVSQTPFAQKIFSSLSQGKSDAKDIDGLIERYAAKNNLDSSFVKAVIKQESGFQPEVTSHCGAMGLMQLMPATASSMGVQNAFDPEENIMGGTKYLKGLMDRFDGRKDLALAAYNAGPGAVQRYGGIPPYNETQNYVKNVLANYERYKTGGKS